MVLPESCSFNQADHHHLAVRKSEFFEDIDVSEIFPEMFRGVKSKIRCHLDALIVGRLLDFFVLDGKFQVFDIVTQVRAVFEGHIEKDVVADNVHIVELHTEFKVFLLPDWIFFRLLLDDVHRKLGQLQVGKTGFVQFNRLVSLLAGYGCWSRCSYFPNFW